MQAAIDLTWRFLLKALCLSREKASVERPSITESRLLEEETLDGYKPEYFYPVRIGETLNKKYQVVGKLGYGADATVWLCKNLSYGIILVSWFPVLKNFGCHRWVAIKVFTRVPGKMSNRELDAYERMAHTRSAHPGRRAIRAMLGKFTLDGPDGEHVCLVQEPMNMTVCELQKLLPRSRYDSFFLRVILGPLLQALDFLHKEAHIVHTDIKANNIMLRIGDEGVFPDYQWDEQHGPAPAKKIDDQRSIYVSRTPRFPNDARFGAVVLCDLGRARLGDSHQGEIQPDIYRAPEVLFEMEWTYPVDIWNVGVMIWTLFEDKHMMEPFDEDGEYSNENLAAEITAYLGLPPLDYLERSEITRYVFDEHGQWTNSEGIEVPLKSLEGSEENLQGQHKELFLAFVRSMLQWRPEDRKTAKELLEDPWLHLPIGDDD